MSKLLHRAWSARAVAPGSAWRFLVLAACLSCAALALARPGGGHSFGGGSSSDGGDGDAGDIAGILFFLIRLAIEVPVVGVPLLVIAVGFFIYVGVAKRRTGWDTSTSAFEKNRAQRIAPAPQRRLLETVRAFDPDFSLVLFEDFAYALYAAAHETRGRGELQSLSAYLGPKAREALTAGMPPVKEVKGVVVGSISVVEVTGLPSGGDEIGVRVIFETNYTEVTPEGAERTVYARERWRFVRKRTARSRPPAKARVFGCPNCGAALTAVSGSTCSYCGKVVDTGEFDWVVTSLRVLGRETRPPQLVANVEEKGTHLPTLTDPSASADLAKLRQRDPTFTWEAFLARINLVFNELQVAWSTREWSKARPFVSDSLFQMQLYWIESYRRAHLRNITERARIERVELTRVTSDRYFDGVTVRVFATGLDYTVTDDGRLVSGSKARERPYSEYWTLVRGTSAKGAASVEKKCPSCGAPLQISMAGNCEYCQAKVTSGAFDWVLSRIEQDESYEG